MRYVSEELFMIGLYKDGELKDYIHSGRPSTIRVYESYDKAKRGIVATRRFYDKNGYECKILKVGSLEEVTE